MERKSFHSRRLTEPKGWKTTADDDVETKKQKTKYSEDDMRQALQKVEENKKNQVSRLLWEILCS